MRFLFLPKASRFTMLAAACLLASACSVTPSKPGADANMYRQHLAALQAIDRFDMNGRIAVQTNKQGFSGRFDWQHQPAADHVGLYSPLGTQVATISRNAEGVQLATSDRKTFSAPDAETLTERNLGWRLPLRGLNDWAVGRPAGGSGHQVDWDDTGRIVRLQQDGWDIEYGDYRQVSNVQLPHKIYLKSPAVNLKLLVEQWQNLPAAVAH